MKLEDQYRQNLFWHAIQKNCDGAMAIVRNKLNPPSVHSFREHFQFELGGGGGYPVVTSIQCTLYMGVTNPSPSRLVPSN